MLHSCRVREVLSTSTTMKTAAKPDLNHLKKYDSLLQARQSPRKFHMSTTTEGINKEECGNEKARRASKNDSRSDGIIIHRRSSRELLQNLCVQF